MPSPPPTTNSTQQQSMGLTNNDDRILLELLAKKLSDLAPLHGDMIKLLATVDNMKSTEADLKQFKDKIMDPERGLFSKIQGIEHNIETVENDISHMTDSIDELPTNKKLDQTDSNIAKLREDHESLKKMLEDAGGKNLLELTAVVKLKNNMSKVYWALIASAFLSVAKLLLDVFKAAH